MTVADHDAPPSLVDVALYAPLGLAVVARDELPKLVQRRRQAVENRIVLARWIGQLAVQQARRELTKRIEAHRSPGASSEPAPAPEPAAPAPGPVDVDVDAMHDTVDHTGEMTVPAVDDLPIAGYESLAALHVVQRLASLRADELDTVRRFEAAHRGRRTILAKIEQLQAG